MKSAVALQSDPTLSEAPAKPRVEGEAKVAFKHSDGETRLADLYQHDPLKVLFPLPGRGENPIAVLASTSGGLLGGDRLGVSLRVAQGAKATFMAQAAEKVYRSTGEDCLVTVSLKAERNSWLEYLPQETILFDQARLRRCTELDVGVGGKALAGEILVLGRTASGESFDTGLVRDEWRVRQNGRLIWADALLLEDNIAETIAHPAGFNGAVACATAVYVAEDAADRLDEARELLSQEGVRAAATVANGILILRWLGPDALALRKSFGTFWAAFRNRVAELPDRLPRLWNI